MPQRSGNGRDSSWRPPIYTLALWWRQIPACPPQPFVDCFRWPDPRDEQAAQAQALRAAALKARAQAEALAQALGLKINRVHSVMESSARVQPLAHDVTLAHACPEHLIHALLGKQTAKHTLDAPGVGRRK
jgi:hypothetical protein